jgi:hypothetical protein
MNYVYLDSWSTGFEYIFLMHRPLSQKGSSLPLLSDKFLKFANLQRNERYHLSTTSTRGSQGWHGDFTHSAYPKVPAVEELETCPFEEDRFAFANLKMSTCATLSRRRVQATTMAASPVCLLAKGYPRIQQPLLSYRFFCHKGQCLRTQLAQAETVIFNETVLHPQIIGRDMPFPVTYHIWLIIGVIAILRNLAFTRASRVAR